MACRILAGAVAAPIALGLLLAPSEQAQSPAPPRVEFDVATVKPNKSGREGVDPAQLAHGGLTAANRSLKMLIASAYRIQASRIEGGPSWLNSDRYDIVAKGNANATNVQIWLMLQSLLADRFKLVVHRETRELPIYALVVARNGPKLHKVRDTDCAPNPTGNPAIPPVPCGQMAGVGGPQGMFLWGKSVSLAALAGSLSNSMERPVVDKTGLAGTFDVELRWTPEGYKVYARQDEGKAQQPSPGSDDPGPSIFAALQEQLGLKLESAKGPVEVLIIDRAERPTDK